MKKITLLVLFSVIIGNAQCPVPSNLTLSIPYPTAAQLSWTENGTATAWEVTVVPDFYVGAPLPTDSYYVTSSNPFIFVNFPPTGCNVFFVRSRCSPTDASSWVALGSLGCSTNVYSYLATLSNNSFSLNLDNNELQIFPNPSKDILNINLTNKNATSISIYNSLGQLVLSVIQPKSTLNVSELKTGTYFMKVNFENETKTVTFIKE
ncbi:T9SS type A sorting domain-containing protein [Flavobacterium sp. F372]|jgi:hypothetical protein|uniref:T9SS type A sorting domain-containing protein n=1 Tax=Flavobacterium bernardetii TaxID=2813823 RepID=A0ABR7IVJ0_9FLAO|nr:T9SS type A sorting domain-containing protein [Flavobacterium bernardetii]MBC5833522.1 T9SS type A sorting domain-containing protein [Flavobacterium bernardetii]NHF68754.1 T9SS type A sorting domain-containing protein [Flavobacterium bernardetii]